MSAQQPNGSRYQYLNRIGTIWLAVDQRTKAKAVVRAADTVADPAAIEKLAEIRHAGLPRLIGRTVDPDGKTAYVFEYLEGCSLAQMADQAGGALTQEILMPIILAVAKILGFLHRQGEFPLVHLDIKPDHILIGSNDAVSLIDFGASQLLDGQSRIRKQIGHALTPAYAAPEQAIGKPSPASDVFALGLVFLHLMTGQALSFCRTQPTASLLSNFPDAFQRLIYRCLHREVEQRFAHGDALASALASLPSIGSDVVANIAKTTGNAGAQKEIAPPQQPASVICVWGNADFGCELAAVLAEHEDVLVIDADLLNPRADLILGCGQPKTTGSDPLEAGGLDLALTCESRGHLDVISLNQYIRSTRVKGVSALTTTSGPTQYESFQLNALAKVIHLARLICRFVVILCSAFIFDGFTCLGLRMADRVLVPVAADIGSFREKNLAIDHQIAQYNFDINKLSFVAFPYSPIYDLSRGCLDELSRGHLIGTISDVGSRRKMKCGARPYAAALAKGNRHEYRDLIRKLRILPGRWR
ncbi:MAG: protein kinase domain-containing protein [Saccharofermentanales bacterium]|jgi:serine/threonine protein kinase